MYIAIGIGNTKVIASNMKVIDGVENSYVSAQGSVTINVMSKTLEAFNRKEEVVSSLRSVIAQQVQTQNSFKLGEIPTAFNDLSNIDGSAIPYRYTISVNMLYSTRTVKTVEYYEGENMIINPVEIFTNEVILDTSEVLP